MFSGIVAGVGRDSEDDGWSRFRQVDVDFVVVTVAVERSCGFAMVSCDSIV